MKRKDWALVTFFTIESTFFLRNTGSRMCIVQFLRKKCQFHTEKLTCMYPAAISLLSRKWSTCYSTEPFTRREVVMQENSCINLSFIFLLDLLKHSCIQWVLGHKHNVNFKASSTCFNVDKKPWGKARGLQS